MDSISDEENQSFICRKTRKKRRSYIEDSESSSEQDAEICTTPQNSRRQHEGTRSSERIQKKQSKVFSMPKKEDVWNKIPSKSTPNKELDQLKPRKIVNNFTKISHRYNYDPAYTDDEGSSLDGFIAIDDGNNDDSESDGESSEANNENMLDSGNESDKDFVPLKTKNQKRRVIGYRKRIQQKAEISDDSSDTEDQETQEGKVKSTSSKTSTTIRRTDDDDDEDDSGSNIVTPKRIRDNVKIISSEISSAKRSKISPQKRTKIDDDNNSSDSDVVTPKRTRKRSMMESDKESDDSSDNRANDKNTTNKNQELSNSDFSSDEILESLPLNQIIESCNKDSNDNEINIIKISQTSSHGVIGTGLCNSNATLNSDTTGNQSNNGADSLKVNSSKKSKVHVIESSDSDTDDPDFVGVNIDGEESRSDTSAEETSSNSGEESNESFSSSEDTSEQNTSRSALQQKKKNQEREKRFEKFKEARKKFTALKSPDGKKS